MQLVPALLGGAIYFREWNELAESPKDNHITGVILSYMNFFQWGLRVEENSRHRKVSCSAFHILVS